jgi:hypothetical protein
MIGQTPVPAPSTWQKIQDYAGEFEDIYDAPLDDTAAVIGVDTVWLGGFLLGLKFLLSGLWMLKRREGCPVTRRS